MSRPFIKKIHKKRWKKVEVTANLLKLVSCCLAELMCPAEGAVNHPETLQQLPVEPVWILRFLGESAAKSS